MKIMVTSFKRSHAGTAALSAPNPAAGHCRPTPPPRLLDTHGQGWVSLSWGPCCSFLGPGTHKVLFVPSKSLFPQSCVSSGGSMVGLMVTSFKRSHAGTVARSAPNPAVGHCQPTPPLDTHGQVWVSLLWGHCSFPLCAGAHKSLFFLSPV